MQAYATGKRTRSRVILVPDIYWNTKRTFYILAALPNILYFVPATLIFFLLIVVSVRAMQQPNVEAICIAIAFTLFILMEAFNIYALCADELSIGPTLAGAILGSGWFMFLAWYFWPLEFDSDAWVLWLLLSPQMIALVRQLSVLAAKFMMRWAGPIDEIRVFLKESMHE